MVDLIKSDNYYTAVNSGEIKLYALNSDHKPYSHTSEFFNVPKMGFFLRVFNTGRLYKLDSNVVNDSTFFFKRIDATVNLYYNIGSFIFSDDRQIYEYGGYGFWKNNGVIRTFNFKDKEWDVVELNKEIIPPNNVSGGYVSWIDPASRYLFVPYQEIRNDGVSKLQDEDDLIYESFRLNLKTFEWEHLGHLDKKVFQLMKFATHILQSNKGLLLACINRIYWVDYSTNRIKVSYDPSLGQTLLRVQPFMLQYWNGDQIYVSNPVNGKYDSLRVDLSKFADSGQAIWKTNTYWRDLLLFGVIALALFIFFFIQRRVRQQKKENIEAIATAPDAPFLGTEIALLELLLSKYKEGKTATIPEINYVLGLKDKNHGMQKKVRSEIINRINEKYLLISKGKDTLIQNIRSESDKRFFEYLINPSLIAEVRKLVAQSA